MSTKGRPDDLIPDMLIVDKLGDIKILFSEKHNRILKLVMEKELSISDIARTLNVNPGSVYYHLKELEKHGLVRQVREEIKGGVVKKFYRSAARRILLESPNINAIAISDDAGPEDFIQRLIRSIEYLGYYLPPENMENAKDMLFRYDMRIKDMLKDLKCTGLDNVEGDKLVLSNAFDLILNIRARNDPELSRIYSEFDKLFLKYD
jgi:DNA-binding transcriptional ArsR family regulator